MKRIIVIVVLFLGCQVVFELNVNGQDVLDPRVKVNEEHVRYSDLLWTKRVWRRIDLRQKMNYLLYYPESPRDGRISLFESIQRAAMAGELSVYDPGALGDDDSFKERLSILALYSLLNPIETVTTVDPFTLRDTMIMVPNPIRTNDVIQYELKEDWFFDKERSVMQVRIVGICPLVRVNDPITGQFKGYKRLFWIPYQELKHHMVQWTVPSVKNAREVLTFYDIFNKRIFDSLIIKESNVYDRYIFQYAIEEEAILESDRIEKEVLEFEHDLWSY